VAGSGDVGPGANGPEANLPSSIVRASAAARDGRSIHLLVSRFAIIDGYPPAPLLCSSLTTGSPDEVCEDAPHRKYLLILEAQPLKRVEASRRDPYRAPERPPISSDLKLLSFFVAVPRGKIAKGIEPNIGPIAAANLSLLGLE